MEEVNVLCQVVQPSKEDYSAAHSNMPCNTDRKQVLFDLITAPRNILRAIIVAEATESSPVMFYEKMISEAISQGVINDLERHEKQFVGTVTCVVMESNGWKKTGKKQRYTKGLFKSAELYEKVAA